MRIYQVTTAFGVGGIGRHVVDLTRWLRKAGHSVHYVGAEHELLDRTMDDQFHVVPLSEVSDLNGGHIWKRIGGLWRSVLMFRRHLKADPVDLIHCHESAPALVAKLASLGTGIPIAVTYHGSEPGRVKGFGRIARLAADIVITPSRRCSEELHEIGGVPRERLRVIGLGVDPAPSVDPARVAALRKELLGEDGRILVLLLSRTSYQKGLDILLDVVERLNRTRDDFRFVVAGNGPEFGEITALAEAKCLKDRQVRFIGSTLEPYLYLNAADIYLLTSRWEALPISIVEAFRAGKPVIAPDTGGCSELVDESVGAIVNVGDVEGFARELARIADDPALRASMGEAGRQRSAEDRFTPDAVHRAFERLYLEMAG